MIGWLFRHNMIYIFHQQTALLYNFSSSLVMISETIKLASLENINAIYPLIVGFRKDGVPQPNRSRCFLQGDSSSPYILHSRSCRSLQAGYRHLLHCRFNQRESVSTCWVVIVSDHSDLPLQVFIWDILVNLVQDFQLLRENKASLSSFIYFVSRWFHIFTLFYPIPWSYISIADYQLWSLHYWKLFFWVCPVLFQTIFSIS